MIILPTKPYLNQRLDLLIYTINQVQQQVSLFNQSLQFMIVIITKKLRNMPIKIRTLLRTLLIILLLITMGIFFLLKVNYAHQLQFSQQTINIHRDQFNIPHIEAPSFSSMMYAWGWVTAEDRIFQISFRRLLIQGRLSEFIGPKTIKLDRYFRDLGFQVWAQRTAQRMKRQNASEYLHFVQYTQGINEYVKSLTFMPVQFYLLGLNWQDWTVKDIFSLFKILIWSQSRDIVQEYLRSQLLTEFDKSQAEELLPYNSWFMPEILRTIIRSNQYSYKKNSSIDQKNADDMNKQQVRKTKTETNQFINQGEAGSNSWVISANHTSSGHPLLVNDPHLLSAMPGEWHQVYLSYKKNGYNYKIIGAAMTGLPSIIGKTNYAAFAFTTIYSDIQDLYKEQINQQQQYLVDKKWKPLIRRQEVIKVKGAKDQQHVVYATHRGPILNYLLRDTQLYDVSGQNLSLAWTAYNDEYKSLMAYSHVAEIDNFNDLVWFLKRDTDYGPSMNILYMTNDDHIGYQMIGTTPRRSNPIHGLYVKDGSSSQYDWTDFIKGQEKINIQDPARGFIVTANNKPITDEYENGALSLSTYTMRAIRLEELIESKLDENHKFSIADMIEMQLDTVDVGCRNVLPYIIKLLPQSDLLLNFDCDFHRQSYQATIYEVLLYQLHLILSKQRPLQSQLYGILFYQQYLYKYIRSTALSQSNASNISEALKKTKTNLSAFFGTDDPSQWKWQKYHSDVMIHRPFSSSDTLKTLYERRFGGRGNLNTPNVGKMSRIWSGNFATDHRANIRTIMSFYEPSIWIIDGGTSQKFYSKHYDDQQKLFIKNQYIPMGAEVFNTFNYSSEL